MKENGTQDTGCIRVLGHLMVELDTFLIFVSHTVMLGGT